MVFEKLCAVVITYIPEPQVFTNISNLANQFHKVIVVDNGSNHVEWFDRLPDNTYVVKSDLNLGLASALNLGILLAMSQGYWWVATFDQDSLIQQNYVQQLRSDLSNLDLRKIGIVSSRYIDRHTGYIKSFRSGTSKLVGKYFLTVPVTMTSGSLMNVQAIEACGVFKSEMFIDQLDNEICLRMRSNGYIILEHQRTLIEHSVGRATVEKIGKVAVRPSNHSPLRRYYMSRNRMSVYRSYIIFDPLWFFADFLAFCRETIKILLFESEKMEKVRMIARGLRDGLMRRGGRFNGDEK